MPPLPPGAGPTPTGVLTSAVRQALAAVEKRAPDGRRLSPQQPRPRPALEAPSADQTGGFLMEKQLHAGHPLGACVHRAGCTVIQRDANPVSADEARQALTGDGKFFRACEFCRPGTALQIH